MMIWGDTRSRRERRMRENSWKNRKEMDVMGHMNMTIQIIGHNNYRATQADALLSN